MEPIIGALDADAGVPSDLIKESDTANFAVDVIDASMQTPVVVDFWATWCGPCKTLGPLLEKTVKDARGAVRMVKVDIDKNQELAAQLRIQSVPSVYAFYQGRPVDGFVGAQPESQVKAFVERLAQLAGVEVGPSPVEQALEEAQAALDAGQPGAASAIYGQILQHEPESAAALAGLINCRLAAQDQAGAQEIFDSLTDELKAKPELASVAAQLELAQSGVQAGEVPALQAKLEINGNDHQARFDLAMAFYAMNQRESAADELLALIQRDRKWNEEAARKQLLKFFDAWGPTDPLTLETRRRLSSILFS